MKINPLADPCAIQTFPSHARERARCRSLSGCSSSVTPELCGYSRGAKGKNKGFFFQRKSQASFRENPRDRAFWWKPETCCWVSWRLVLRGAPCRCVTSTSCYVPAGTRAGAAGSAGPSSSLQRLPGQGWHSGAEGTPSRSQRLGFISR